MERIAARLGDGGGRLVVLTGAGISAESGIPTFRGPEGYWTVGSEVYQPEQMATQRSFRKMPHEVWKWYLHRRQVCRAAEPNPAHRALATLEESLGERFLLVTQNVDGLHLRAGNSMERCFQIHGNIDYMRCADECSKALLAVPDFDTASDAERDAQLRCPSCGARTRPHVLWFDEYYDEELFRFESSLRAASKADVLITVGTTASTNLPVQMFQLAHQVGALTADINPNENAFGRSADVFLQGTAGELVPALAKAVGA